MKGVMATSMVKLPQKILSAIKALCKRESEKRGQLYSVSAFLREAAIDKLKRNKKGDLI